MNFFDELKRRNVFRVGFAYAVVGWLVAQVADLALESFGAPGWVMKTLLFLMLIGFVLALFIAWAYELTPEGIKRAEDIDPNQSITHQTGRKLDKMVIVVLLLAVGMLLSERFWMTPRDAEPTPEPVVQKPVPTPVANDVVQITEFVSDDPSVAVLPFVNMSSDPEQEYFSDGISEEILNVLTRIPNLKVAARTSSFQFKGKTLDIADIGKQLQVNHLLEGSVRKSGTTLRITAQLIETESGFHLWSETYDRNPEDVFAIQDEIAAAIAVALRTILSSDPGSATTPIDMQAYELYLKGRGLVARRRAADLLEGIEILKAAIAIEPEYAPAMATMAQSYVVLPYFSDQIPSGEAREQARHWAEKALAITPQNVEALAVLAIVYNESDINPVGALELLTRAVNINPGSVVANNFLGDIYTRIGDLDNAVKYESRAAELDPLGPIQLTDLANVHILRGEYDKTIRLAKRALTLDATFFHAYQHLVDAYYFLGDVEQLARVYEQVKALPDFNSLSASLIEIQLDLLQGRQKKAENALKQRVQLAKTGQLAASTIAGDAVLLGDFDSAGELLLKAYQEKDGRWIFPLLVRLPEQAPDSAPWQEFWRQPGASALAELRRNNGFDPNVPLAGSGANP